MMRRSARKAYDYAGSLTERLFAKGALDLASKIFDPDGYVCRSDCREISCDAQQIEKGMLKHLTRFESLFDLEAVTIEPESKS